MIAIFPHPTPTSPLRGPLPAPASGPASLTFEDLVDPAPAAGAPTTPIVPAPLPYVLGDRGSPGKAPVTEPALPPTGVEIGEIDPPHVAWPAGRPSLAPGKWQHPPVIVEPTLPPGDHRHPAFIMGGGGSLVAAGVDQAASGRAPHHDTRTFAFAALGVFGRSMALTDAGAGHVAPAATGTDGASAPLDRAITLRAAPMKALRALAPDGSIDTSPAMLPGDAERPAIGEAVPMSSVPRQLGVAQNMIENAGVAYDGPGVIGDVGDEDAVSSASSATKWLQRDAMNQNPASPFNLLVTGQDDAVAVSVRSAVEGAQDAQQIRRLVENTLAEFGLELSDLHLNGASHAIAQPTGGFRGSRTR